MSAPTTILFAWVGDTDLRAAGARPGRGDEGLGPVAQVLESRPFDRAELLFNDRYSVEEMETYLRWIRQRSGGAIRAERVHLDNVTRHAEIHEVVVERVDRVRRELGSSEHHLAFHLSPGTPAMHAVWLLLAKSRYPAELVQASRELGVETVDVPFDIDAVFLPDHFRRHDKALIELAAGAAPSSAAFDAIKHRSSVMADVIERAGRLAPRSVPVLLLGESGTGKELFARAIHAASPRAAKSLLAVNCGALPEALAESELFGHRRGAFTGADKDKIGVFERGHGSTVFLDEVGELPLRVQVKLLRFLQEGEVQPLGSEENPRKVDVRIIAATHRDLTTLVAAGTFRDDLFYRLAVGVLHIPPLKNRGPADLNSVIDAVMADLNAKAHTEIGVDAKRVLSPGARKVLREHPWPGNVRELVNTLTRAVIFSRGTSLKEQDIRDALLPMPQHRGGDLLGRPVDDGVDLPALIDELKRHYLKRALDRTAGNKTQAARLLGLENHQTLTNWTVAVGLAG